MSGLVITIIILAILIVAVLWVIGVYNNLVSLRNRVGNGWAQIDVQLKQRSDLIPNLVNTVKGYAAHESNVFVQVTQARSAVKAAEESGNIAQRMDAENALGRAIVNVLAVAEAYPQLQANTNFMDLQNQLKTLEEKIAYSRQFYNDVALKMNNAVEIFPNNIVAGIFHFEKAEYFKVEGADREVPQVQF
ncbi:LemA family protein [Alloscardovia criceti]|uniref:LemA family protein n=1 Tax=Alloscardovia criceti TaxID=356828 RepID=UPI000527D962|nr:LemA family protein [Alloscardovia criceti]